MPAGAALELPPAELGMDGDTRLKVAGALAGQTTGGAAQTLLAAALVYYSVLPNVLPDFCHLLTAFAPADLPNPSLGCSPAATEAAGSLPSALARSRASTSLRSAIFDASVAVATPGR